MLTLTNPLTIEGFSVFRDDQSSTQFYVEPGQPTIALDPGGKPIFSLIVYRRDEARIDPDSAPKEDIGGGILTFTVELTVPPEKFRAIHSKVRSIVYGDDSSDASQDVQLAYVDFFDGSVSVAVAGEGTGDADGHQFVSSAVGNGKIEAHPRRCCPHVADREAAHTTDKCPIFASVRTSPDGRNLARMV